MINAADNKRILQLLNIFHNDNAEVHEANLLNNSTSDEIKNAYSLHNQNILNSLKNEKDRDLYKAKLGEHKRFQNWFDDFFNDVVLVNDIRGFIFEAYFSGSENLRRECLWDYKLELLTKGCSKQLELMNETLDTNNQEEVKLYSGFENYVKYFLREAEMIHFYKNYNWGK